MSLFEPEETVGLFWHRLVGGVSTYGHHTEAAVSLEAMRTRLGVMYRAFGGSGAIRLAESAHLVSPHRLSFAQKVGLGVEKMDLPVLDATTLRLPSVIDMFPARKDNEALYEWLVGWFAHAVPSGGRDDDPLRADLYRLRTAIATTRATLAAWPGLVR
ncbi:MAG: protein norD, partial [Pseudomonadota bacterium]